MHLIEDRLVITRMKIRQTKTKQTGVGMIEILVTLFILSVGLLGVASLQFVGSFANVNAISRTQAEMVAKQTAERLRAAARISTVGDGFVVTGNYFESGFYNFANLSCASSAPPHQCFCLARPAGGPDCQSGTCNEDNMAVYDAWAMSCSAVQANPKTTISVSCADSNTGDTDACSVGSRIGIMLRWPVSVSESRSYSLVSRCNPNTGDSFACVYKDITL